MLLKSAGLYHNLHGTGSPVPWVHLCTPTIAQESEVDIFFHCLSVAMSTKIQKKAWEEHYSTPFQQRMTGWIYCTNFSANFLQMSSGSSNSNQHLSELNWIAQNHTWNLLMGANFTLILIYIVQLPKRQMSAFSLWFGAYKVSDYCDSLGLRTCQDFLISRIKMFLWYSFLFSENIYNHVY